MFLAVLMGGLFSFSTPAFAWQPGEHAAQRHCEHGHVLSCIHRAALHFHQDYGYLKAVSWCESRWNPGARNPSSSASGLFQFLYPSTWDTTPYRWHSVWSAKWNALAAAYAFRAGRAREWSCA